MASRPPEEPVARQGGPETPGEAKAAGPVSVGPPSPAGATPPPATPSRAYAWRYERYFRILIVTSVVAMIVLVWINRGQLSDVQHLVEVLGYPGIFLLSLMGSGTLFLPLPSAGAVFFGGAVLSPVLVGLVSGVAEALGEMIGYGVGYSGRGMVEKRNLYRRMEGAVKRRGGLAVFLGAIVPNPFFDVLGLAAGVLRYPPLAFLAYAWGGKTIKSIGIAFAGYYGAEWISRLPGFGFVG